MGVASVSLLAVLLAWPVAACTAATASPQAQPRAMPRPSMPRFKSLNGPAFLDVPSATIEAIRASAQLLPANDPARDIHFRSVFCNSLQCLEGTHTRGRDYSKTAVQLAHQRWRRGIGSAHVCALQPTSCCSTAANRGCQIDTAIHLLKEHQSPSCSPDLEMRGDLMSLLGEQAKAMLDFQRAHAPPAATGITQEVNPLMFSMAVAYRRMGDWDRAAAISLRPATRAIGDTEAEATNLLQLSFSTGNVCAGQALSTFSQAVSIAQQHADTSSVNAARTGIAEAQILLGKPDAALSTLQRAHRLPGGSGQLQQRHAASAHRAGIGRQRTYAQALQRYQQALPLIQANGSRRYLALHQAQASGEALGQPAAALQDFKNSMPCKCRLRSSAT